MDNFYMSLFGVPNNGTINVFIQIKPSVMKKAVG